MSKSADQNAHQTGQQSAFSGVVVGLLVGYNDIGEPLVAFPGNPEESALPARATTVLGDQHIGREVALLFEGSDPGRPILIGPISHPGLRDKSATDEQAIAVIDGERIVLSAQREIVFKCGQASITMTKAGKILMRGKYLLSRSSGVNCIKGGSVQIN